MQITLNLPDELAEELQALPHPDLFISDLIKATLYSHKSIKKRPLGALKDRLTVQFHNDFKMTDDEFLNS
ncbi:hypothetical protein TI05_05310 [Achromatium sp. WMS3]|nr:hypothetical protein TI05_05310 [Achromatium sp. WMS3]